MKPNSPSAQNYLILTLLAIQLLTIKTFATNYYVSNNGDDSKNGLTPETAWETISHVNGQEFNPGDSILFQRGNTWRNDPLRVSSSGNLNNPVVYGAYGEGEKPEILGSISVITWTNVSGNIWASENSISNDPWQIGYDGPEIFFERGDNSVEWGVHQDYTSNYSNLINEFDWTWNNNTIYIYSSSNPNSLYREVEIPQQAQGILLLDHNYVSIDGLAVKYFGDSGIYDQYSTIQLYGLRVVNCETAYIGRKEGGAAYGLSVHHSNSYYAYNEIHDCGRRGVSLTIYQTTPITQSNIIIEHNHFYPGFHTTSLDCSTTGGHTIENITFRNNLVEGNPDMQLDGVNPNSNHIFMDNQSGGAGLVRNIFIYNNIFVYAHGSSVKIGEVANVEIYNNTFYNFNPSLANWQAHVYLTNTPATTIVKNNIFYNNATDNRWTGVKVQESTRNNVVIDNNLYYQSSTGTRFYWCDAGTSYRVDQWETYKSATGYDVHSSEPENPLFKNAPTDFSLSENSPAIGIAEPLELVKTDYYGNTRSNETDLGAIQYNINTNTNISSQTQNPVTIMQSKKGEIKISLSNQRDQKLKFRLLNLQGMLVYQSPVTNLSDSESSSTINVSGLKKGVYILECSNGNSIISTEKVLVR